jgi:hypothetical protein
MSRISIRQMVLACVFPGLMGCYFPMSPDAGSGDWTFDLPEVFLASPPYANILRGDTLTATTCMAVYECGQGKPASANWSVARPGFATIVVDGAPQSVAAGTDRVVLQGIQSGEVQITAVSATDQLQRATVYLRVVDSSAISSIHVYKSLPDSVRRGTSGLISARLLDSRGMTIRGRPTSWSVSDTNVVALDAAGEMQYDAEQRDIRAVGPGTADIHVRFQDIVVRLRLVVRE